MTSDFLSALSLPANLGIALSYFLIPLGMARIIHRLWNFIPSSFRWIVFEFALFILSCGFGHLCHAFMALEGRAAHELSVVIDLLTFSISFRTALRMPAIAAQAYSFITQNQLNEAALIESEERFRAFANNSLCLTFIKSRDRVLMFGNQTFETVFGHIPLGKRDEEWLPSEAWHTTMNNDEKVLRTGEPLEGIEMVPVRGRPRSWLVQKFRFINAGEFCLGGVAIDITQQQITAAELQRRNDELEEFSYVASHDLAQPLRSIRGFSEHLLENLQARDALDDESRDYLQRVIRAAERMERLMRDLLEYSRAGRKCQLEPVDLNVVIAAVLDDLSGLIQERQAQIQTCDLLPSILIDEQQISQVFSNLISNAIKYTPASAAPKIKVSVSERENHWLFSVADQGEGIRPEHVEIIFHAFKRLHGAEIQGTGIGLALCKKIVEYFGGQIWVRSHLGVGSTFWFTLPKANLGDRETYGYQRI